jgi:hypothetical protein
MSNKEPKYRELTLNDRKAIFSVLWIGCKNGKCEHGQKSDLAKDFQVAPRTISRVWESVLSVMQAHLINELLFDKLELFDSRMLPLREFPDHVFETLKRGTVGRKKKHCRKALAEKTLNVPMTERGTYRNLAAQLNVPKNVVSSMVKEGVLRVHQSHVKPLLNEKQKQARYAFAVSKIDLRSLTEDPDKAWQYEAMMDEVHVDEKWFDETFESRKFLLVNEEEDPIRKTRHKSHIPKIMFLSAQARPRRDPHTKHWWDGKIALIPIGHWVKAKKNSKYYKKGDEKWKNRNVDTQAYFEHMEDIVREIAIKWPRGQWRDPTFTVKIQQDGARPHTSGAFREMWENLLVSLYMEGVLPSVNKIELRTQPAQSPDTNVNDNGLFNALQAGYKRHAPKNARETIQAVFKTWREYPHRRINHMWLTLQTNFDEIIKCNGDNTYKIRHMSKEKLDRVGQLPTVIAVSKEARQKAEENADEDWEPTEQELAEAEAVDKMIEEEHDLPDVITEEELAELQADSPDDDSHCENLSDSGIEE